MSKLEQRLRDIRLKIMLEMPLSEKEYCLYALYGKNDRPLKVRVEK